MKILIVRFSSIGDIVLTTPVIRAIHAQRPDIEIHYLTKKAFRSILEHDARIHTVHTYDKKLDEVIPNLQAEQFDHIIDLHNNLRTLRLKNKLKRPSVAFKKLNIQKWLLVNFKVKMAPNHVVDRYFDAVAHLGIQNDHMHGSVVLPSAFSIESFGITSKQYVAVAIGAQFATKIAPPEVLAEILKDIQAPIVLLGGPTDVDRADAIVNALANSSVQIINAVNKCKLMDSVELVRQAKVLLAHDTGLMHFGASFGTPIVSIWGNTVPELGFAPYYPNQPEMFSIHEVEGLSCRPCSKIGHASCPKKHFNCMQLQNKKAIAQDVNNRFFA